MKKLLVLIIVVLIISGSAYLLRNNQNKQKSNPTKTVNIVSKDESGKIQESSKSSSAISLKIIEPKEGTVIVNNASFKVAGVTVPSADVFIAEQEIKADSLGRFSTTLTLDEGENIIVVLVNDTEGNSAEETLTITLQSGQ